MMRRVVPASDSANQNTIVWIYINEESRTVRLYRQGQRSSALNKVVAEDLSLDQSNTLLICNSANCVCPHKKRCLSVPRGTHGQTEMVRGMDLPS